MPAKIAQFRIFRCLLLVVCCVLQFSTASAQGNQVDFDGRISKALQEVSYQHDSFEKYSKNVTQFNNNLAVCTYIYIYICISILKFSFGPRSPARFARVS